MGGAAAEDRRRAAESVLEREMKGCTRRLLPGAAALAVLGVFLWWGLFAPAGTVFQLYDRRNEKVVLEVPAGPGDQFRLEIEHSFEHIPWLEFYTVLPDGS